MSVLPPWLGQCTQSRVTCRLLVGPCTVSRCTGRLLEPRMRSMGVEGVFMCVSSSVHGERRVRLKTRCTLILVALCQGPGCELSILMDAMLVIGHA
eukprot:10119325-Alexandrium_andersonii.AAC.1